MQATDENSESGIDMKVLSAFCFDTLLASLDKKKLPKYPEGLADPSYPIFVTWTIGHDDDLRGCIGTFAA